MEVGMMKVLKCGTVIILSSMAFISFEPQSCPKSNYGAWSTGNISEKMVEEYLEHHRQVSNNDVDTFMLE